MTDFFTTIRFPTHWGDMDALGHVNHTRYLVWMETARIKLFHDVGLMDIPNIGPILANINADYHRPIHHISDVWCGVRITRVGTKSFTLHYAIGLDGDETYVAEATTVIVVYDYHSNCSTPIPDKVRALLLSGVES